MKRSWKTAKRRFETNLRLGWKGLFAGHHLLVESLLGQRQRFVFVQRKLGRPSEYQVFRSCKLGRASQLQGFRIVNITRIVKNSASRKSDHVGVIGDREMRDRRFRAGDERVL